MIAGDPKICSKAHRYGGGCVEEFSCPKCRKENYQTTEHKCDSFCTEYGCMKGRFCDQDPSCGNPIGKHKHVTAKIIGENEMSTFGAGVNKEQPMPKKNDNPAIWDLVISEMKARDKVGQERYHTRLQGNNGRDALRDALDEALDLCVYLRQAIYERDGK